jgi:cell division protein FtsI/penicillin-binding protein 2
VATLVLATLVPAGIVGVLAARKHSANASPAAATSTDDLAALVKSSPLFKPQEPPPSVAAMDTTKMTFDDRGAHVVLGDKRLATLTIDPQLQHAALALMKMHHVPEAAVVMMDVATGRVLVYASATEKGAPRDLCVEATAPSASVFKIVTGSTLVETGAATMDTKECYSGGEQRVMPSDLEPDPRRDRWCSTLAGAMGRSINTIFARLAMRSLHKEQLETVAKGFGYGESLPFDVPIQPSSLNIPDDAQDKLNFARTAAGFWNTTLSPIHAASLSATIARSGEVIRPILVADVKDPGGEIVYTAPRSAITVRRAITPETAGQVAIMMEHTVSEGTSWRAFHDAKATPFLPNIQVAGKTGTLTDAAAQRYYTWFTGFAPLKPQDGESQVAIAVLAVNGATWHVKANVIAREMLRAYFAEKNAPGVSMPQLTAHEPRERVAVHTRAPAQPTATQ